MKPSTTSERRKMREREGYQRRGGLEGAIKGHGRGISVTEATACIFATSSFRHRRNRQVCATVCEIRAWRVRENTRLLYVYLRRGRLSPAWGCNHTQPRASRLSPKSRYSSPVFHTLSDFQDSLHFYY